MSFFFLLQMVKRFKTRHVLLLTDTWYAVDVRQLEQLRCRPGDCVWRNIRTSQRHLSGPARHVHGATSSQSCIQTECSCKNTTIIIASLLVFHLMKNYFCETIGRSRCSGDNARQRLPEKSVPNPSARGLRWWERGQKRTISATLPTANVSGCPYRAR